MKLPEVRSLDSRFDKTFLVLQRYKNKLERLYMHKHIEDMAGAYPLKDPFHKC
jgi:hypothetical protein